MDPLHPDSRDLMIDGLRSIIRYQEHHAARTAEQTRQRLTGTPEHQSIITISFAGDSTWHWSVPGPLADIVCRILDLDPEAHRGDPVIVPWEGITEADDLHPDRERILRDAWNLIVGTADHRHDDEWETTPD